MRNQHSNWREDLREVADIPSSEPETETKSKRKVEDKKVNNKIVINPTMKEAFGDIGALILEVTEIEEGSDCECEDDKEKKKRDIENLQNDKDTKEGRKPGKLKEDLGMLQQQRAKREVQTAKIDMKIARERTKTAKDAKTSVQDQEAQQVKEVLDMKKADMGEVITDFRKSDAPQFKGKSDKKKQQMAIAAKLNAEEVEPIDELNRYGKETGKATGSLNKRPGSPVQKGGSDNKAFRAVKNMMRDAHGKPPGQQKKVPGKKPPVAGTFGARQSPAQRIASRRNIAKGMKDNMSSRFD
jgi:hypothetical protein